MPVSESGLEKDDSCVLNSTPPPGHIHNSHYGAVPTASSNITSTTVINTQRRHYLFSHNSYSWFYNSKTVITTATLQPKQQLPTTATVAVSVADPGSGI